MFEEDGRGGRRESGGRGGRVVRLWMVEGEGGEGGEVVRGCGWLSRVFMHSSWGNIFLCWVHVWDAAPGLRPL